MVLSPARGTRLLCWSYFLALLLLALALQLGADRWWPATVLLFSPRWALALPLLFLVPLCALYRRASLFTLALAALVLLGPLMGFRFALRGGSPPSGGALRVITCNVDNGRLDQDSLLRLILDSRADLVALQEYNADKLKLPLPPGWHLEQAGGLAILSRLPMRRGGIVPVYSPGTPWPFICLLHCVVTAPFGEIDVCSLQLPTARFGLMSLLDRKTLLRPSRKGMLLQNTAYRERASSEVRRGVDGLSRPLVVAGDFNMPVESAIYRAGWGDLENGFSRTGRGFGFTQRAVLKGIPLPVRIDHVLAGRGLSVRLCRTGADVGSDHLPLIADISR